MLQTQYRDILRHCVIAILALIVSATLPARAGEVLNIYIDHSKLIALPKRPATVIVGNPSIADVTLDGDRLFLHGRGFGNTNLAILDDEGRAIGDYEIYVELQEANSATVFKNGARQSYSCAGDCQPTLTVGDLYTPHFQNLADSIRAKIEISRDEKGSNQTAPPIMVPAPLTQ